MLSDWAKNSLCLGERIMGKEQVQKKETKKKPAKTDKEKKAAKAEKKKSK